MCINSKLEIALLEKKLIIANHRIEEERREKEHFQRSLKSVNQAIALLRSQMDSKTWEVFESDLTRTMKALTNDLQTIVDVFGALGVVTNEVPEGTVQEEEKEIEPTEEELLSLEEDLEENVGTLLDKREEWGRHPEKNPSSYIKNAQLT